MHDPVELARIIDERLPLPTGPSVATFSPPAGWPGSAVEIEGLGFSTIPAENEVLIGGDHALVVGAAADRLRVIAGPATATGPVAVTVAGTTVTGPHDFTVLPYPDAGAGEDGPPMIFQGAGVGQRGDVPSTGTLKVIVALVCPSDLVPPNPSAARQAVADAWANVHTFYDQASYGTLDVQRDILSSWTTLTGSTADYVSFSGTIESPNIKQAELPRLTAEAAQACVDAGFDLNDYQILACVLYLNGQFIRAWGGWSQQNFSYSSGSTNINITLNHALNLLAIQESADWGRFAHETGHNIVSAPTIPAASPGSATLGEDVYSSDLVDPNSATAQEFEMMGDHDAHPCFSAYHMEKLGYYGSPNVLTLQWDRNAFSQDIEVVAHGPAQNTVGARYHVIKIRVADGLYYYIEVRQRPGATVQVFDANIPLGGATHEGGVVVYKVLTDTININEQLRFITLLHDPQVLRAGDVATDPLRALRITVLNDHVVNRPLVCTVRVAWAQGIADDPNGAFDLRVEPWNGNWETPDIWIDRQPYGMYDQGLDSEGRPTGNGDKPRPMQINKFWARLHCDGTVDASDVRLTFYSVIPPGVGDNGNWAPLQAKVVPTVAKNDHTDVAVDWVPVVGQHTCLKVAAEQQLGEITGGNNSAQENIFDFEAPASSQPAAVVVPVAIRNPYDHDTVVLPVMEDVPTGFTVQFPHSWVWMKPKGERRLDMTVIPTRDYNWYRESKIATAAIRIHGSTPRTYADRVPSGVLPGSRMVSIGGILARVTPKRRVDIKLAEDRERNREGHLAFVGAVSPGGAHERVSVMLENQRGGVRWLEAETDPGGVFRVLFDLTADPEAELRASRFRMLGITDHSLTRSERERGAVEIDSREWRGAYRATAYTFDSPTAAEATSNTVVVTI